MPELLQPVVLALQDVLQHQLLVLVVLLGRHNRPGPLLLTRCVARVRFGSKVDIGAQSLGMQPFFLLTLPLLGSFGVVVLLCADGSQPVKPVLQVALRVGMLRGRAHLNRDTNASATTVVALLVILHHHI